MKLSRVKIQGCDLFEESGYAQVLKSGSQPISPLNVNNLNADFDQISQNRF